MAMTSMNISLPTPLKEYVEAKTAAEGYSTPSEYVRELIRRDKRGREQSDVEGRLLAGMESPLVEAGPDFWNNLEKTALARATRKPVAAKKGR
ncbi:MAG: ribbon-helix-helix domain-containing protein [Acidobacteriaceae bacterium]